ncbi:WD40 repeat domain-containing protein [Winogradskya humida]|uniref:WD40 repeat protein n=1 Tax=Winogradskya humida TaxID=113566 RepID=A0ABQ4A4N6_9ACTN|nr:WD40 repeat domain-containing protein [Actinoplanes humidus]GIE25820.1 hypothetical protein Ahu01nite_089220 [Actinoplanes humidus]
MTASRTGRGCTARRGHAPRGLEQERENGPVTAHPRRGVIAEHDGPGYIKAFVDHGGRLLQVRYDVMGRVHLLQDALTGTPVGAPFPGHDTSNVATIEVDGHLWVVFVAGKRAGIPLTAWDVTAGREVELPPLWDAEPDDDRPIENLWLSLRDGVITALVQWGYQGRNGTEVWVTAPGSPPRRGINFGKSSAIALAVLDGQATAVAGFHNRSLLVFDAAADALVPSPYYTGAITAEIRKRGCCFADIAGRGALLVCGPTSVLWDLESGLPVATAPFGEAVQTVAAGVLDGHTVFAVLTPAALQVWDPRTSRTLFYQELPEQARRHARWPSPLTFVEFAGRTTVARRFNQSIEFHDARTGEIVGSINAENLGFVDVLTTGRIGGRTLLAAGDRGGPVQFWDPATGRQVEPVLQGHRMSDTNAAVSAIAFTRLSGRDVVVTGGLDKTVRLWDATTGDPIGTPFAAHTGEITALLPASWDDEETVISVAATGAPRMWMLGAPPVDTGHTGEISALVAGVRNGRPAFASSSADGTIRLWDAATTRITGSITAGPGGVTGVAFGGPSRDILISVTESGRVQRWDANSLTALGTPLHNSDIPMYAVSTVDFDGRALAGAAGADQMLRVWDVVTGEQITRLPVGRVVQFLSLAAAGGRLLAFVYGHPTDAEGTADSVAALWDVPAGQPVNDPVHLDDGGEVAALGVLNARIVTMHGRDTSAEDYEYDGPSMDNLELHDALTGTLLHVLDQHDHSRNGAVVMVPTADRTVVVAGFENGTAILDDTLTELSTHKGKLITAVAATEVDGTLVAAAADQAHAVHIWRPVI